MPLKRIKRKPSTSDKSWLSRLWVCTTTDLWIVQKRELHITRITRVRAQNQLDYLCYGVCLENPATTDRWPEWIWPRGTFLIVTRRTQGFRNFRQLQTFSGWHSSFWTHAQTYTSRPFFLDQMCESFKKCISSLKVGSNFCFLVTQCLVIQLAGRLETIYSSTSYGILLSDKNVNLSVNARHFNRSFSKSNILIAMPSCNSQQVFLFQTWIKIHCNLFRHAVLFWIDFKLLHRKN